MIIYSFEYNCFVNACSARTIKVGGGTFFHTPNLFKTYAAFERLSATSLTGMLRFLQRSL